MTTDKFLKFIEDVIEKLAKQYLDRDGVTNEEAHRRAEELLATKIIIDINIVQW